MHLGRVGFDCFQHIDQRWQRLPLDLHKLKTILREIATFGGHRYLRLTDIAHLVYRNRVLYNRLCTESRQRTHHLGRIAASQDCVDARHLFGSAGIDTDDTGMSIGAAQHSSMEHTRQLHVVGILRSTREQIWILAPLDVFTNLCIVIGCCCHLCISFTAQTPVPDGTVVLEAIDWAALCTALIMCW